MSKSIMFLSMLLACQFLFVAAHPRMKREVAAELAAPGPESAPGAAAAATPAAAGQGEGASTADGAAPAVDTDDRTFGLLGLGFPGMGLGGMGLGGMGMGMGSSYYNQMGMGYGGMGGMGGMPFMG